MLLQAIKQIESGGEAPGLIRSQADKLFPDFICTSGFIEDHEDGPSFCRRVLGEQVAAK